MAKIHQSYDESRKDLERLISGNLENGPSIPKSEKEEANSATKDKKKLRTRRDSG